MGARSDRLGNRRSDAIETKAQNEILKTKERARRNARMLEKLRSGTLPYAPPVMSWLSRTLDKKAGRITPEDVKGLLN